MKKSMKILSIMLVAIMVVMMLSTVVSATNVFNPSDVADNLSDDGLQGISVLGGKIVSAVTMVASIVSVLVLVILGIKYMMGSAEEKAEYKKTLIPYFVGAILVFAASAIAGAVYTFAGTITL